MVRRRAGEYRRRRLARADAALRDGTEDAEQTALLGGRGSGSPVR